MLRQTTLILQISTRGSESYSRCKLQCDPPFFDIFCSLLYTNTKTAMAKNSKVAYELISIFIGSGCGCPQIRREIHDLLVTFQRNKGKTIKNLYPKFMILTRAASTFTRQFQVTLSVTLSKLAKFQRDIHLSWGVSKFGL